MKLLNCNKSLTAKNAKKYIAKEMTENEHIIGYEALRSLRKALRPLRLNYTK